MKDQDKPYSHLNDAQAHGKKYDYKAKCQWCDAAYDTTKSDAPFPKTHCSADCGRNDLYFSPNQRG